MRTGAKALAIVLMAATLATQVFAAQQRQHHSLGRPAVQFGALKFYAPWQGVQWAVWWCRVAPRLFLVAGGVFMGTNIVLVGVWIWLAQSEAAHAAILATWATTADLRRAKLLRRRGVVVGRLP